MSIPELTVGLIGCGYAASIHLAALRHLPHVRVVAVADIDESARRRIAESGGGVKAYADYKSLLDHPAINTVAILTPPYVHLEMTSAALAAGKHIMLEKPITHDLVDADQLVVRASASASKVIVGYNLRFHRHLQEARRRIATGELGKIAFVRGVASSTYQSGRQFPEYRRRRQRGGGVLIELAVHHFDLWKYLLAEDVEEIVAVSRPADADDTTATVIARMTSGILVTSAFSEVGAEQHEIEIYGDRGRIRASLYRFDGFDLVPSGDYEGQPVRRLGRFVEALGGLPGAVRAARRGGVFLESFRSLWQHFAESNPAGSALTPTLEEGRRSLQVAFAAVHSADTGRAVRVVDALRTVQH